MKKVMILGGMGLIGQNIARMYNEKNELILVDNGSSATKFSDRKRLMYEKFSSITLKGQNISFVDLDLKDVEGLGLLIRKEKPDIVIYLAALLSSESTRDPQEAEEVIYKGVKNTIEVLESSGKKYRFIYASSSYVYGNFQYSPADENHVLDPLDTYGKWKVEAEKYIMNEENWVNGIWNILRPSSVYGIGDPRERYATTCIEQAYFGNEVELYYPEFICDFTYVKDVAQAFILASESLVNNEIFNVTNGKAFTNKDFVDILKILKSDIKIIEYKKNLENAPVRGALDSTKAEELLGWVPTYNLEEGINDALLMLESLRKL